MEWGCAVRGAQQDAERVTVRLGDDSVVRCAWLVGCDGAHSRVRKLAGIGFPGVQIVERFLLADVHADLPVAHDTASVWLKGDEMLAAFPLPGADLWRLMAPAPAGAPDEASGQEVLELLVGELHERTGCPTSVVRGAEWTSTFRIHRRLAERFREGRMLLAGDAAHIHSPVGGQGLNTGLGDAENLAWKLALVASRRVAPALLDSYAAERRPIAAEVLESTSAMTRMVIGESVLARVVRDRVFVPLLSRRVVQRMIWEQASQLKVHYRSGPLARTPWWRVRSRPLPGDRVPDLACCRADGNATRLDAELGSRWVLLVPSPAAGLAAAAIERSVQLARERLGADRVTILTPAEVQVAHLLLVRPDAHLAWRGTPSAAALDAWLAGVLHHGVAG